MRAVHECLFFFFFFSSRRRHTRLQGDWSSDVCSSDLSLRHPLFLRQHLQSADAIHNGSHMADSLNDITRASFTLGTNHGCPFADAAQDRKSTRLNSSHLVISYAVFCLKKKKITYLY